MKRPGFLKRGERIRLQSFLARSGVASRRAAEEMITHGRIAVNGETVTAMGLQVVPGVDRVEVDGEEVKVAPTTWLALHKPTGYVTTRQDPFGRQTVYDLIPEKYHGLFHVGRLDRDSEGLLLLTNDGDLANRFLHPSFGITKEYDVIVTGKPSDSVLRGLVEGVELEDGIARAESAKLIGPAGNGKSRLKMVLREGKKREVRRMLEAVGHEVTRLVRRRFGPIDLAELPEGKWRIVAPEELAQVRDPRGGEKAERAEPQADEPARSRAKAPARAAHNAYGDGPSKRHDKPAAKKSGDDAPRPRAAVRDDEARPRGKSAVIRDADARPRKSAAADRDERPRKSAASGKDRPRGKSADDDFRPPRKPAGDKRAGGKPSSAERPARPGARPARPAFDADAPPKKRTAPVRTHARELDDWADAPRVRGSEIDGERGRRPGQPPEKRVPAPRGNTSGRERPPSKREERAAGPKDRATGGFDRPERPSGPRDKAGPRGAGPDRTGGTRARFGGEDRPPRRDEERAGSARGKPGPRDKAGPRGASAGGPRGRFGAEDRPPRRDEERAGPTRGKPGPRDRAAGGEERGSGPRARFGGDDRPPRRDRDEERGGPPRGRTPDHEGRPAAPRGRGADEGPAPRRFDRDERGGAPRGAAPPAPRAPAFEEEDELDSWGTAPRRPSRPRGGGDRPSGGARGGKPAARGGKPSGGRPSGGGKPSGRPGGGKPGGKGGGKPGGPGKPRRPGGGGGGARGR